MFSTIRQEAPISPRQMQVCSRRLPVVATATLLALLGVGNFVFNGSYQLGDYVPSESSNKEEQRFSFLDNETQLKFMATFIEAQHADSVVQGFGILPLILKNNTVLCMSHHKDEIHQSDRTIPLMRMIHEAIDDMNFMALARKAPDGIPLLFLTSDSAGCELRRYTDVLEFPRMTWFQPSQKHHGEDWCTAIPIPTYHSWNAVKHHISQLKDGWKDRFDEWNNEYPWENKTNKAFWRGSTTYDLLYDGVELSKTPRGMLVEKSLQYPELVDAAFVQILQQYEDDSSIQVINETEWRQRSESLGQELGTSASNTSLLAVHPNQTRVSDYIGATDQQGHKAILDIDGNSWSSRFPELLCMNSVVIKIDPDYVEYFHFEQRVKPMIHYVPASLENLTRVVQYVMAEENDEQMRQIVSAANDWCNETMNHSFLANDMSVQIGKFHNMLQLNGAAISMDGMVEC